MAVFGRDCVWHCALSTMALDPLNSRAAGSKPTSDATQYLPPEFLRWFWAALPGKSEL